MPSAQILVPCLASTLPRGALYPAYGGVTRVERDTFVWGAKEGPPSHCIIEVTGIDKEEVEYLRQRWGVKRTVQYQNLDVDTDIGEARFYGAQPINSYGNGVLTQADIQGLLDAWEIIPIRTDTNEIIASVDVAEAGRSLGFLGVDRENHRWLEPGEGVEHVSYTNSQHLYKVYLNQALEGAELQHAFNKTKEELEYRGAIVQNADSQSKTFEYIIQRNDVANWTQRQLDLSNESDGRYSSWRIPASFMDELIAGTLGGKTYNYQTVTVSSPRGPQAGEFLLLDDRLQATVNHTNYDGADVGAQWRAMTAGRRIQINGTAMTLNSISHNAIRSDMVFESEVPWLLGAVEPVTLYNGISIQPYRASGTIDQLLTILEDLENA